MAKYEMVCDWPLREALASYEANLRRDAIEQYRTDLLCYAVQRPWAGKDSKPPELPEILR